jgi:hypothetical protein
MKLFLFVLGVLVGMAGIGTRAEAQNYPWCAQTASMEGGMNCGFTTYQQCMSTVSGTGGFCQQNTQYKPTAAATAAGHPIRHNSHVKLVAPQPQ